MYKKQKYKNYISQNMPLYRILNKKNIMILIINLAILSSHIYCQHIIFW